MPVFKTVANPHFPATLAAMLLRGFVLVPALVLFVGARAAFCEDGAPPPRPPQKPEDQGKPPHGGPGGPGHGFGFGGGMMKGEGMDRLSEDEKKRLRAAVEKVWENPEVAAARERIIKANAELRTTLREALQKSDPDVVAILEKVKSPAPWEQHHSPPPMPRPEDPDFPRQATARLGFEMMSFARPEQREAFRHLHERVLEQPGVKQAISRLQEAPQDGRMEAFKNLRDVYKHECEGAIAEYRRKRAGEGGKSDNLASPAR
ncbi:MAG: hypothetical protein JWO94_808 [Verrucomicrobiaceae bacterium]|nr:hypothetical protein [Verrucomicrobiaceae bacterium]